MRKSRFAGFSDEKQESVRPLSLAHLLLFDFREAEDSHDDRVARERVRALGWSAPFLTVAHLVCGSVMLASLAADLPVGRMLPVLLPLASLLLLDFRLWALTARRAVRERPPHAVTRLTALYALLGAILWASVIGGAVRLGAEAGGPEVAAALAGGMAATVAAFIAIPGLVVIVCVAAVASAGLFAGNLSLTLIVAFFAGMMSWLSLFRARDSLLTAQRRMIADWRADRAGRFVEEFEQVDGGWFWETNAAGQLAYVSPAFARALGAEPAGLVGRPLEDLLATPGQEGSEGHGPTLGFHLSARFPFAELAVTPRGRDEPCWALAGRPNFDEYGRFLGFRGLGLPLTADRRAVIETQQAASVDSLTGLPNRARMRSMLDEALANAAVRQQGCSLFLIDLDRFKQVNDTLGHPVGDVLLQQVAERMVEALGEDGQVGRLGGDEFKAVLPGIDEDGHLAALAEQLIRRVTEPYVIRGHKVTIGASVGIAIGRPGRTYAEALVKEADLALYAAKAAGRGTFRFFENHMHEAAAERRILENDLRNALAAGQLRLVYQPLVGVDTEDLSGFEALVRWAHPTRGLLAPAEFLPLAEGAGLACGIGEWVLRNACEEAARWPSHLRISVNVAAAQLDHPGFPAVVAATLAASGLDPARLELELRGELLIGDSPDLIERLERLRALGIRLAIDGFGAASMVSLRVAPVDRIKLDPALLRSARPEGSRSETIVTGVVTVAGMLGFEVVATGIETLDELAIVRRLGCAGCQGFLFGRPADAEAARALALQSEPVSAREAAPARPARHSLIRRAALRAAGASHGVRLRNISAGGAMLESTAGIDAGERVELDLADGVVLAAEVRWSAEGRIGLKFDEAFDLQRLGQARRRERPAAPVLRPDYLNSETSPDSPWAARQDRFSLREVKRR